jgi:hypothetical protein
VPAYYSGQLQLTLAVFQVPMMHFVQMGSDGDIDIIPITRVEGYFDARIEKVTHFINRVESYRRENPDWEQAYLNWEAAGPTLPLTIKQ